MRDPPRPRPSSSERPPPVSSAALRPVGNSCSVPRSGPVGRNGRARAGVAHTPEPIEWAPVRRVRDGARLRPPRLLAGLGIAALGRQLLRCGARSGWSRGVGRREQELPTGRAVEGVPGDDEVAGHGWRGGSSVGALGPLVLGRQLLTRGARSGGVAVSEAGSRSCRHEGWERGAGVADGGRRARGGSRRRGRERGPVGRECRGGGARSDNYMQTHAVELGWTPCS